jgi:hypothetical protein
MNSVFKAYDYDVFRFLELIDLDCVKSFNTIKGVIRRQEVREYPIHKNICCVDNIELASFKLTDESIAEFKLEGRVLTFDVWYEKNIWNSIQVILDDVAFEKIKKYY